MNELHDKSVLILDDDPAILRATSRVLSRAGMKVTALADPLTALKTISDAPGDFDVLITDLRMPEFSGSGILGFAGTARPELPVIVITAYGGDDVNARALNLGAFAILEKPVAAGDLLQTVQRALA